MGTVITSLCPFLPSSRFSKSSYFYLRGVDKSSKVIVARDDVNDEFVQSTDYGETWSDNKWYPTNAVAGVSNFFKNRWYYLGVDMGDGNKVKLWRSDSKPGNELFEWELVYTLPIGSIRNKTSIAQDANYMYFGAYGDPAGGIQIWRTPSGDVGSFELVYQDSAGRHVHDVRVDPFTGHVWATMGDGGNHEPACYIMRSISQGAPGTWKPISRNLEYQAVQISFLKDYVVMGGDCNVAYASLVAVDKNTLQVFHPSYNTHYTIAVPGSCPYSQGYEKGGANALTNISRGTHNKFMISMDGDSTFRAVTLTLSNCDTGVHIAAEMQTQIRALGILNGVNYAGVTVTFNPNDISYTITSPTKGKSSMIRCYPYPGLVSCDADLKLGRLYGAIATDGTSDTWCQYTYWCVADLNTGIVYCVSTDPSNPSEKYGLFYLPYIGGRLELLEYLPNDYPAGQEMFILDGYLMWGQYKRPLLSIKSV